MHGGHKAEMKRLPQFSFRIILPTVIPHSVVGMEWIYTLIFHLTHRRYPL